MWRICSHFAKVLCNTARIAAPSRKLTVSVCRSATFGRFAGVFVFLQARLPKRYKCLAMLTAPINFARFYVSCVCALAIAY